MGRRKKADEAQFTDLERMKMFVERTQALVKEPIWKSGGLSVKIKMLPSGLTFEEPDAGLLKSYLVIFRPFLLENDAIYFHAIRNIAHRYLRQELAKQAEYLQRYKQKWNDAMGKGYITVRVNETVLSPEAVLDIHLYGYFFHYRHSKALKQFEKLPVRVDKIQLYTTLIELTDVICQLGNFIACGLKHDHFDFSETRGP